MPNFSPWDDIAVPRSDFNVRQVPTETAVPCFWGRDASGACLLIVELQGDHTAQYRKNVVTVKGIDVDLRSSVPGQQRLVLALGKQVDRDLFAGLCHSLVTALESATDAASSLALALMHLRRWKAFLSGRSQRLSEEEMRGLFAELAFLLELMEWLSPAKAIDAWLGPDKSHQDFIYGNKAVEVKSLSGAERSTVRISSEDQLESLNDELFLRIYRLSNVDGVSGARSLNDMVTAVQVGLDDAESLEGFDAKLAAYHYAPLPDYDEPHFIISAVHTYRVQEDFPRLVRSQLVTGLTKVAYDIRLEAITSHECESTAVLGGS